MTDQRNYQVCVVGPEWFDAVVPCRIACPAHTNVPRYISLIAQGCFDEAYEVNCAANVFPGVLGRICVHFCEQHCRRAEVDEPVAICALKRAAADYRARRGRRFGPQMTGPPRAQKVAVVGSGPAGLTVAHDLALSGYHVAVFEALPVAGGMLHVGLPPYRLPREIIQIEAIQPLQDLGVEFRVGQALGKHFTLSDLQASGFAATVLATGCMRSRELDVEGVHLQGVLKGVDFLLNANLGRGVALGEKVLVIGGGNVAIDVARSALRTPGESEVGELMIFATDVARSAMRLGAPEVHIVCLERREEMPAYESETRSAEEEGIQLHPGRAPKRILGDNGRATGLEVLQVASVFDEQGRFNPRVVEGTEEVLEADTIILAIGQMADLSFLTPEDDVETSGRGLIAADPTTGRTSVPGVFAVGDVVVGPKNVIEVIADAHQVSAAVRAYLGEEEADPLPQCQASAAAAGREDDYDRLRRTPTREVPPEVRRSHLGEVDLGYTDGQARREAQRCLQCDVNIFIDAEACVLCAACVDACPYECIRMIPGERIACGPQLPDLRAVASSPQGATALVLDEKRCIRCGICVERCPAGAITMERIAFEEVVGVD